MSTENSGDAIGDREAPKSTLNEIFERRFVSLKAMANELAGFPGFDNVSSSTIFRWLKSEREGETLPDRALKAIQVLARPAPAGALRVAYPDAPSSLPLMLLALYVYSDHLRPPVPLPAIRLEHIRVPTGLEGLQKLIIGKADVAVCYRYYQSDTTERGAGRTCVRVSSLCRQFVHGWGIQDISSRQDLPRTRFGYPFSSGIGLFLADSICFDALGNYSPKPFADDAQAVKMLIEQKIHYALANQGTLSRIKAIMERDHPNIRLLKFPPSLLPPVDFDLFVNTETKNPSGVLTLLDCLFKVTNNLKAFFQTLSEEQQSALASELGYASISDLRSATLSSVGTSQTFEFAVDRFVNLAVVLTLWNRTTSARL